jgi:hypothetical protein
VVKVVGRKFDFGALMMSALAERRVDEGFVEMDGFLSLGVEELVAGEVESQSVEL